MTQCQDNICTSLGATLAVIHDVEAGSLSEGMVKSKKSLEEKLRFSFGLPPTSMEPPLVRGA